MSKETNERTKDSMFNKKVIFVLLIPVILLISLLAITSVPMIPAEMNITAKNLEGSEIVTSGFKGKIQILEFMATWCDTCEKITYNIRDLLKDNQISSDVVFISVTIDPSHDTPEVLRNYIIEHDISQYVSDGRWVFLRDTEQHSSFYQVTNVPHTFLVDKDLQIIENHLGLLTKENILDWINLVS